MAGRYIRTKWNDSPCAKIEILRFLRETLSGLCVSVWLGNGAENPVVCSIGVGLRPIRLSDGFGSAGCLSFIVD